MQVHDPDRERVLLRHLLDVARHDDDDTSQHRVRQREVRAGHGGAGLAADHSLTGEATMSADVEHAAVRTFALPPKGFEPLKTHARDLLAYGFPPRPEDPRLLSRWKTMLGRPISMIQPRFRNLERTRYTLPSNLALPVAPLPAPTRTNYIGGATTAVSPGQGTVRWIEGTFTLPNIYLPVGADSDGYPFSTWVGIFGDASTSSLLAGWDSYVVWTGRELQRSHYVWWNWAPGDTQYLGNFYAQPGDTLSIVLCLDLGSTVRARLSFFN